MLTVSNAAMTQLHNSLKSVSDTDTHGKCFRIIPRGEAQLALSFAEPAATDKKFEHDGETVLAVPKELQESCAGKTLDVNDDGKLELA